MKLSADFLHSNPTLTTKFVGSSVDQRRQFFNNLKELAEKDLSLAHSTFKVSAARTVLSASDNGVLNKLADNVMLSGFSVYKSFDTATAANGTITGTKHWITNLSQAEFGVVQCLHNNEITLYYVDLAPATTINKIFSHLNTPGLMDTCTGDIRFDQHPATLIFKKSDARYFISNNHNSLCFISNHIGAVNGLLMQFDKESKNVFAARYKNVSTLLDYEITHTSGVTTSSDAFWHSRNALYLDCKQLLSDVCQYIIANCAGNFYSLATAQGQHFYNSLIYSGHNGPIARMRNQLYTEPQDY